MQTRLNVVYKKKNILFLAYLQNTVFNGINDSH